MQELFSRKFYADLTEVCFEINIGKVYLICKIAIRYGETGGGKSGESIVWAINLCVHLSEQLDAILARTKKLNRKRDVIYEEIMDSLREYGVHMLNFHKIEKEDRNYLERYFEAEVAPVISPSTIRSSRLIMHRWIPRRYFCSRHTIMYLQFRKKNEVLWK